MSKRVLAFLLAVCMCMGLLAGCASGNKSPESETTGTDTKGSETGENEDSSEDEQAADYSDHIKISAWMHTDDNSDGILSETNENPVIAYLAEKFNVTFEWQLPPTGSESEQMSLMIGSGDYTNVFDATFSQQSCEELYEDGVIQDLTPYVEQYMPNYLAYIESGDTARKSAYANNGKILYIPSVYNEPTLSWGGMMYNHQILVDMTDDNVAFPSGEDAPATVEDWEYMLELMKQYYETSGLTDYACLIIPAAGYFPTGDILTGFGTTGTFYIDDNGDVQYGLLNEQFYNYLVTMKDWYAKGYIYQDFASRNSDPYYFPNTALTWSGSAGLFYGLTSQLYGQLSMPEYGLEVDYRALTAPLDTPNNATALPANGMIAQTQDVDVYSTGWVVSSKSDEATLIRWLQICDYLFSEEGSMMKSYGLTKEQAGDNAVYARIDLEEGAYWFDENGEFHYNPVSDPFTGEATIKEEQLRGNRLPGLHNKTYYVQNAGEGMIEADKIWISNGYSSSLPGGVTLTVEENNINAPLTTVCDDYIASIIPKFIMGTEALTEESFEAFTQQLRSLGMDTRIEIYQTAYDRYMEK